MELQVKSLNGQNEHTVQVSEFVFNREFNEPLVHQVIVAYQAAGRAGTKAQKNRSDVRGGGKKPWKQKGSGRARAGSNTSPLWRTGGVTFAARTRDFSQKVNRKMYRGALCAILSQLLRQGRLVVVDDFIMDQPKTRDALSKLKNLSMMQDVLIVTHDVTENLYLSTRNIPKVDICDAEGVDPYSLVQFKNVVMTVSALKKLEEVLA